MVGEGFCVLRQDVHNLNLAPIWKYINIVENKFGFILWANGENNSPVKPSWITTHGCRMVVLDNTARAECVAAWCLDFVIGIEKIILFLRRSRHDDGDFVLLLFVLICSFYGRAASQHHANALLLLP